jgi:enterochelin esterase family protein
MPMPKLITISACCLLALGTSLDAQRRRRGREEPPPELKHGTFQTDTFDSKAVGRSEYGVYLPKGYDAEKNADKRYPLVIWLHGLYEDHRRWSFRGGAETFDAMIGKGELPELIVVTANGERSSFYINAGKGREYEDLITVDLLEHVEKTYRVASGRDERALMGVSMGGYGALKIAFKHPQIFGVVAAHSAAILPRDPADLEKQFPWLSGRGSRMLSALFGDPVDRERWDAENVLALADDLDAAALAGLKIYFDCGSKDRYGFAAPNEELNAILDKNDIPHTWRLVEGGNHGWRSGYNEEALPYSLQFVAAAWAAGKGASGLDGLLRGPGSGQGKRGDKGDGDRR